MVPANRLRIRAVRRTVGKRFPYFARAISANCWGGAILRATFNGFARFANSIPAIFHIVGQLAVHGAVVIRFPYLADVVSADAVLRDFPAILFACCFRLPGLADVVPAYGGKESAQSFVNFAWSFVNIDIYASVEE